MTAAAQPNSLPGTARPAPHVGTPASARMKAGIARRALEAATRNIAVDVVLPGGTVLGGSGSRPTRGRILVADPDRLFARLAAHPVIGAGEAYAAGEWSAAPGTDLANALLAFADSLPSALPTALRPLRRLVAARPPAPQDLPPAPSLDSPRLAGTWGARRTRAFAAFLEETIGTGPALFSHGVPFPLQSLAEAQNRTVDALLDLGRVTEGSRVLEMSTGPATAAVAAARRGARVRSLALSADQAVLAGEHVAVAGVADRVAVRLDDYRDVRGRYHAVLALDMLETLPEDQWPGFVTALDDLLAPGGAAALQTVVMPHERYLAHRSGYGWGHRHLVPGDTVPSITALELACHAHTDLRVSAVTRFGAQYAETLRRWRATLLEYWPEMRDQGETEQFLRTAEFSLAYAEAGFRSAHLDVAHIRLERVPGAEATP